MSAIEQFLANNDAYAAGFAAAGLAAPPAKKIAIVACMDARLDPAGVLGIGLGDAHVIRSLAISQHYLGTEEIMLLHHTRCGMQSFSDEEFAEALERQTGERPPWQARTFEDLEEDVRDGIRRIRENPFIQRRDSVRGFVYEVETGRVREVL